MKLTRRKGLRLHLDPIEIALLQRLLDDLENVLAVEEDEPDDVHQRLYPAGYRDDDKAAAEFRALTEASLRSDRADRIEACRAELAAGRDIDLRDPDAGQRWLKVLNDLRLTAGTRLGITEDEPMDFDPYDPAEQPRVAYYWLTAVQDSLVRALMR